MNAWLPIVAALAGTAVGGAIAYWNGTVQWRRQRATDKNRVLLGKLEEACKTVISVELGLRRIYGQAMFHLATSRLPENLGKDDRIPLEELNVLVSLYFETLTPHHAAVVASRDELGRVSTDVLMSHSVDRTTVKPAQADLEIAYKSAQGACAAFLAEAARLSKGYL